MREMIVSRWSWCPLLALVAVCSSGPSFLITTAAHAQGQAPDIPAVQEPNPVLERFEPLSPQQALTAFDIAPGFRVELVAAEPLVIDPVAFCFDAAGRLIVVEMRGYSERADSMTGRVRRLTDRDGDGQMDHAETLVDGLSWPTAVQCWGDGIVVGVAPDILYFSVTDDAQGRAVVGPAVQWFSGFSRSNVQGIMNSLRWGPDLRLHGASSSNGGDISGITLDQPLRLGRQDFSIDTRDRSFRAVAGGGQHGMDFDSWGNNYATSNSDPLPQVLLLPLLAGRAQRFANVPPLRRSIAADGPAADVYRSSPVEPWRLLRTHLRVSGQVPGIIEGGGRAAGYFTGATGVHIYRGDQWPDQPEMLLLVCDVGGNLVHRKRLDDDGLWKIGRRIDPQTEFLRSSDTWFRPVQLGDGPDGALYVADMYREVIEHPASLPPVIKSQVDLNSGNDRGRIWRVVADEAPLRRQVERLDLLDSSALVPFLEHPNEWQRRTAARLLVQRQAAQVVAALRELAHDAQRPQSRLEALAVLELLPRGVDASVITAALADEHPAVRRRAVELAATLGVELAAEQVERLAADDQITVRFALAYAAVALVADPQQRAETLATIALHDPADPWIRWAVEGSLGDAAQPFFQRVRAALEEQPQANRLAWYQSVSCQLLASGQPATIARLVEILQTDSIAAGERELLFQAVVSQLGGTHPQGAAASLAAWAREQIAPALLERADRRDPALASSRAALQLVGWAGGAAAQRLLESLLAPAQTPNVQTAALATLVGNDPTTIELVLERLSGLTPATRQSALATLASRLEGQLAIAKALDAGSLAGESLPADVQSLLRDSRNPLIKQAAEKHFVKSPLRATGELYETYNQTLHQAGDREAGKAVFIRVCASCHQPEAGRTRVGPDLITVAEQPKEQILLSILDPNREVDARYATVQAITHAGQIVAGVVTAEADSSITIVDSQGIAHALPRIDIEELQTSKKSLMPEDLSQEIDVTQMRDLISYLVSLRPAPTETSTDGSR